MIAWRHHQRSLARFTCLVMLAVALVPTLGRLAAWSQALPSYLAVLCGPQASPRGPSGTVANEVTPAPAHLALDHCPLCALAHTPVVLPPDAAGVRLLALSHATPWHPAAPCVAGAPRGHAPARGPPCLLA